MSHGIDLEIAWDFDIAVESADRDHGFEQVTGSGGGIEAAFKIFFVRLKAGIQLPTTDSTKLLFNNRGELEALSSRRKPKRDRFFEALAA